MCESEQEYIAELQRHALETRELLSNAKKPERERMVVCAFLRCVGVQFSVEEIKASSNEPVDVVFRAAQFQITEILGDRKRGLVWREREDRYKTAKQLSDLLEPSGSPEPISFGEVSPMIAESLAKKAAHYGVKICSKLDILVSVDLSGRYLWPLELRHDAEVFGALSRQCWRSVSILFVPYGLVLTAKPDAPDFLKDNTGAILNKWPDPYGWFDVSGS